MDLFHTLDLIEAVQKRPPLWDLTLPENQRTRSIRFQLWEKVHTEINRGGNEQFSLKQLKERFKNLKFRYRKLAKLPQSNSSWEYYEKLDFLKKLDNITILDSISSIPAASADKNPGKYLSSCRLCLTSADVIMKELNQKCFEYKSYIDIIYESTSLKLETFKICPLRICRKCESELILSYFFKKKIIESESILSDYENLIADENCIKQFEFDFTEDGINHEDEINIDPIKIETDSEYGNNFNEKITSNDFQQEIEEISKGENCSECNIDFRTLSEYKLHRQEIHKKSTEIMKLCPHCGKLVKKKNYYCHLKNHENKNKSLKPYSCDQCDKLYLTRSSLNTHKRLHTDEKRYECNYCFKKFRIWTTRRSHMLRVHLKQKPYVCSICKKSFLNSRSYHTHVRREHTGERPYKCNICDMDFLLRERLKLHKMTHIDKKNFKCDICNKSFKYKRSLNIHIRIHTGEKNYICFVCNTAFTQNHVLKAHIIKIHPEHKHKIPSSGTIVSQRAIQNMTTKGRSYQL